MAVRTLVSFTSTIPSRTRPRGQEWAEYLVVAMSARGFRLATPVRREDWGWTLACRMRRAHLVSIVTCAVEDERQWHVHSHAYVPTRGLRALLNSASAPPLAPDLLQAYCEALHSALRASVLITDIRWYDSTRFDLDGGESWAGAP